MISLVEALRFRCLRDVRQQLGPFQVLVGPNASGKTTFLDTVAFLGRLVSDGLEAAIDERTRDWRDLVWQRAAETFEVAIEAVVPSELRAQLPENGWDAIRYEVAIGIAPETGELSILAEKGQLKKRELVRRVQLEFPCLSTARNTILSKKGLHGRRTVFNKVPGGNDNFNSEVHETGGKGWAPAFRLGPRKSTLGNLPEDESKFPVATWLKGLLATGVEQFVLSTKQMRLASRPGQVRGFKTDGSNLPWVVNHLKEHDPGRFTEWVEHVKTALPDIIDLCTKERPDDRHRYLTIIYKGGLEVPSWVASDGTLRLLALTLPAYLTDFSGVYLIEEPENGIHPQAVETALQSLSSTYNAQILLATHSPVVLSSVAPDKILCFAKDGEGATDIVIGTEHPKLRDWKGEENLSVLYAAGVLG